MRKSPFGPAALLALAPLAILSLPATLSAQAGKAHVETAFATDSKSDLSEKGTFSPGVGTIYVYAMLDELPPATKVGATWIALKTDSLEDNTRIGETVKTMGPGTFQYFFNWKPPKLWPVGSYRVDVSINGKVEKSVPFKVAK